MKLVSTLKGNGEVSRENKIVGFVAYQMHVFEGQGVRSCRGSFHGDYKDLRQEIGAELTLKLKDGATIQIIITQLNTTGDGAFDTTGAIPRF